jgi:hypothetical protein
MINPLAKNRCASVLLRIALLVICAVPVSGNEVVKGPADAPAGAVDYLWNVKTLISDVSPNP